jgi:two-component system phosphate regulon sensor histidine kinase PhoR
MKMKISYLIWACSLAVLALAAIQSYFIYNTFILKSKEAEQAVRIELIKMEYHIGISRLTDTWFKDAAPLFRKNRHALGESIQANSKSNSAQVSAYIKNNPVLSQYNTAYAVIIQSATLIDYNSGDSLTIRNKHWFGNAKTLEHPEIIHDLSSGNGIDTGVVIRNFNSRSSFSINDWQVKILQKMMGLLVFSILLLVFVVVLFYYSIKGLITQKKIADIQTDFINNITHEFNTPLATLNVAISTAKSQHEAGDNDIIANALMVCERQQQRLKRLIDQVISHTAGPQQMVLKKEALDMNAFVTQLLEDFGAAHAGIKVTSKFSSEPGTLLADRFHLTTAISNVLDNAVKYGGLHLVIVTAVDDNFYRIAIMDDGIGISPAEWQSIFEKFYRVEKGNIHNAKGLGLGLYYSRQIAIAHGGTIGVISSSGNGTTFTLTLPLS